MVACLPNPAPPRNPHALRSSLRAAVVGAAGWFAALPACHAGGWDGALGLATENLYRGLALTGGRGAASLDLRYRTDTGWSGFGGVSVWRRGGDTTTTEASLGASRSWQVGDDWATQVAATHYAYGGRAQRFAYEHDDLTLSLGWRGRWFASLTLSPNTTAPGDYGELRRARAWAAELTTHQRLAGRLAFDAGAGYLDLRRFRGTGYPYASIGLSSGVGPVQTYISFVTSRAEQRGVAPAPVGGDHWVASVLWGF